MTHGYITVNKRMQMPPEDNSGFKKIVMNLMTLSYLNKELGTRFSEKFDSLMDVFFKLYKHCKVE